MLHLPGGSPVCASSAPKVTTKYLRTPACRAKTQLFCVLSCSRLWRRGQPAGTLKAATTVHSNYVTHPSLEFSLSETLRSSANCFDKCTMELSFLYRLLPRSASSMAAFASALRKVGLKRRFQARGNNLCTNVLARSARNRQATENHLPAFGSGEPARKNAVKHTSDLFMSTSVACTLRQQGPLPSGSIP